MLWAKIGNMSERTLVVKAAAHTSYGAHLKELVLAHEHVGKLLIKLHPVRLALRKGLQSAVHPQYRPAGGGRGQGQFARAQLWSSRSAAAKVACSAAADMHGMFTAAILAGTKPSPAGT